MRIDGLKPHERELRFDGLMAGKNGDTIAQVRTAAHVHRGLVTLTGAPGTGKTTLLVCAVNDARERGILAVYTTVTDLLDYLRMAYNPDHNGATIDQRWNMLVSAEVLALDELDEFSPTPWAEERFMRLMDERWRIMDAGLTICATNSPLDTLPDKIGSRLCDGRAEVFAMVGGDMRPLLGA